LRSPHGISPLLTTRFIPRFHLALEFIVKLTDWETGSAYSRVSPAAGTFGANGSYNQYSAGIAADQLLYDFGRTATWVVPSACCGSGMGKENDDIAKILISRKSPRRQENIVNLNLR
jgi:hypothetical protein